MPRNDHIEIGNLIVFANHGVLPEEKKMGQKFVVTLGLYLDMSDAAESDDLTKSINYAEVSSFVTEFTRKNRCKLIETAASDIADALLLRYEFLSRVDITLKKPWAPIGLPLDDVSVNLTRRRSRAYIGLGSNIGDKERYLQFAEKRLNDDSKCKVTKVSRHIVTKPMGYEDQDDFLNGCAEISTLRSPHSLLRLLHEIENEAGRTREIHWGPRTLDLDLLLYDDIVTADETLIIPHPEMAKRRFVLEPLASIAPYAYHPVKKDYVINLLEDVSGEPSPKQGSVKK